MVGAAMPDIQLRASDGHLRGGIILVARLGGLTLLSACTVEEDVPRAAVAQADPECKTSEPNLERDKDSVDHEKIVAGFMIDHRYDVSWRGENYAAVFYSPDTTELRRRSISFSIISARNGNPRVTLEDFAPEAKYNPVSLATGWGDINRDGYPDIAVGLEWSGTSPCAHATYVFQLTKTGDVVELPVPECAMISEDVTGDGQLEMSVGAPLSSVMECPVHWACYAWRYFTWGETGFRKVDPRAVGDRYIDEELEDIHEYGHDPFALERLYLAYVASGRATEGREELFRLADPATLEYARRMGCADGAVQTGLPDRHPWQDLYLAARY
jgi:hypothetical protein